MNIIRCFLIQTIISTVPKIMKRIMRVCKDMVEVKKHTANCKSVVSNPSATLQWCIYVLSKSAVILINYLICSMNVNVFLVVQHTRPNGCGEQHNHWHFQEMCDVQHPGHVIPAQSCLHFLPHYSYKSIPLVCHLLLPV